MLLRTITTKGQGSYHSHFLLFAKFYKIKNNINNKLILPCLHFGSTGDDIFVNSNPKLDSFDHDVHLLYL